MRNTARLASLAAMNAQVVCLAGGIGSGKTELSKGLAARLGWRRAAFGEYVRSVARERGLLDERETLQALGESLLHSDAEGFCRAVLASAGWKQGDPLVLDGVRHAEVLELIRGIVTPVALTFIYLAVPEDVRVGRLAVRPTDDAGRLSKLEQHSTEVQVKSFGHMADLILDGKSTVENLVESTLSFLATR